MDPNILHGIEKGFNYPILTAQSLRRLCQIFDLSADDLASTLPEVQ